MAIPRINLGQSAISALMKNKEAKKLFPFLVSPPQVKANSCGSCGGRKTAMLPDYNWLKRKLAATTSENKKALRKLLNTQSIVVTFRENGQSRTVQI